MRWVCVTVDRKRIRRRCLGFVRERVCLESCLVARRVNDDDGKGDDDGDGSTRLPLLIYARAVPAVLVVVAWKSWPRNEDALARTFGNLDCPMTNHQPRSN